MHDPGSYRDLARHCRRLSQEADNLDLVDQLETWAAECDREAMDAVLGERRNDLQEEARRHHKRAEEYRVVAEQMQSPSARTSYQHLAQTYETMTRQFESNADRLGRRKQHSG